MAASSIFAFFIVCPLNNMVSRIKKLLREVREKEGQRRKVELAVVQAGYRNVGFFYRTYDKNFPRPVRGIYGRESGDYQNE